jgi:hypothetical protein
MSRINSKLESATNKFEPSFGKKSTYKASEFKAIMEKTPSTAARSGRPSIAERTPEAEMGTPAQFNSADTKTDDEGNRMSIMPGSARPKTS